MTKAKEITATFTIATTYLMWIGSEHYSTIKEWIVEALAQGVSKRLPNDHTGRALLNPGTIVFVAHDEGEYIDCPECRGVIECPECRKAKEGEMRELELSNKLFQELRSYSSTPKEHKSCLRRAQNARTRALKLRDAQDECELCFGVGVVETGNGGSVIFEDNDVWDYRKYMYYRNQPKKWTPAKKGGIAKLKMCAHCGGFGRLPQGKVFGMFVPESVEYVTDGDKEKEKKMEEKGFDIITEMMLEGEKKRGCGKRKAGGVYVATKPDSESDASEKAAEALGLDADAIEAKGNFVEFTRPIDITGTKRFRGIARWKMPADVEDEAEMIAEAMV